MEVLRRLTEWVVEITQSPVNLERKTLWYEHDVGVAGRPMVLAEVFDVRVKVLPLPIGR